MTIVCPHCHKEIPDEPAPLDIMATHFAADVDRDGTRHPLKIVETEFLGYRQCWRLKGAKRLPIYIFRRGEK